MNSIFYLPYYNYNDGNFDKDSDFYTSNEDYFTALKAEIDKNDKLIGSKMSDYQRGGSLMSVNSQNGQVYVYGQNPSQHQEENIAYAKCDGMLIDENGNDETVDKFFSVIFSKDVAIYMLKLNIDNADEEFEETLNLWNDEHAKISSYGVKLGDDWVFKNEPKRNILVKFKNNADEYQCAMLENCKILEKNDISTYIILAERIKLMEYIPEESLNQ